METISFPRAWKDRYGYGAAAMLAYLVDRDEGKDWFSVTGTDMQKDLSLYPGTVNSARFRLMADGVVSVRKSGRSYEYRINHERLAAIEEEN